MSAGAIVPDTHQVPIIHIERNFKLVRMCLFDRAKKSTCANMDI
jgi:hypothetical protein